MSHPIRLAVVLAASFGVSSLALAAPAPQNSAPASKPAIASSAPMQHHKWEGKHHRRGSHERMGVLSRLDLSDSQRAEIRQMMQASFQQARPEMQALRQKRMAFEKAVPGSSAYQSAASELESASAKAARERVRLEAELRTKVYAKLTPEQRSKLASLQADREQRRQEWRKSHPGQPSATPAPAGTSAH